MQAESLGQCDELAIGGLGITDHDAGDVSSGEFVDAHDFDLAAQVTVREVPGDPIAGADHFSRQRGGRVFAQHFGHDLSRVEGGHLGDLERRELHDHSAVGCDGRPLGQAQFFEDRTCGVPTASRRQDDRNPGRRYSPDCPAYLCG